MTIVLELPDAWKHLLGLDTADAAKRAREMLITESYREGRLSRGQAAEMLGLGFHEAEVFFKRHGAEQQPNWEELQANADKLRAALELNGEAAPQRRRVACCPSAR
jgi:hypothetical protein